ncbi:hypothetical protein VTN00DRAFT_455 [Thermoascus crustaceus]|uniref:uncharacterized protein n=1 Tax=Thermoascus crustaceus TaxID=5088 RepID=UPI003742C33F
MCLCCLILFVLFFGGTNLSEGVVVGSGAPSPAVLSSSQFPSIGCLTMTLLTGLKVLFECSLCANHSCEVYYFLIMPSTLSLASGI